MSSLLSDEVSVHYLTSLREELSAFTTRSQVEIEEGQLRELGDSFLEDINQRFGSENEIIRSIAIKWTNFIAAWLNIKDDYQTHITQLTEENDENAITIQNLQEMVAHLERKLHGYEEQYQKLKGDLILLSEKHEKLESESSRLRKALNASQKELEVTSERERQAVSALISQKEILLDQIRSERKTTSDLNEELAHFELKMEELQRECRSHTARLQESLKYGKQLESFLNQKNEKIAKLQDEVESKPKQHDFSSLHFVDPLEASPDPDPEAEDVLNKSVKLQDEIPFGEPFAYELHRRLSDLNFSPARLLNLNDDEPLPTHSLLKMNMDPYFSHFVLTSQSVKIKEDCQQLLNIDAKPFYAEIVEKRVPMHLWDQWIRNKLKEELRMRKAAESDDQM